MIHRRIRPPAELNLSALIDIFSIMLFFLMTTVTFLTLKTLNASVPAVAKKGQQVDTADGVTVSLEISAEGYRLKASGQPENTAVGRMAVDTKIGRDGEALQDDKLTDALWEIKKKAPEVRTIMLFPEDGIAFQDIVLTMDASREMPSILDKKKSVPLFTRPVLSELMR